MAMAELVAELIWIRNLMRGLRLEVHSAPQIYCDNSRTIQVADVFTKALPSGSFLDFKDSLNVTANSCVIDVDASSGMKEEQREDSEASKTDAKVTGSSPSFKIRKGSAESTQKGGTGRFGVAVTFARREPYLDSFRVVVGLREDNQRTRKLTSGTRNLRHASYLYVHLDVCA
ncbi:hypothetical protein PIB30_054973 [Stylosanthes scabra]|uniref:Uncharacterized protein n=1 Tax=Stylosanthes scabra TaxID=79078 RepID=A0ABU6TIQ8_9FABA|nr:hypothetical protein [Stylosanthes scabra]